MIRARTEQDPRRQDHHNLSRTDDLVRPLYRIGAQLAEPPRFHRGISRAQARQRILALLRLVGIPEAERGIDSYPHQLLGGRRQRVMIAISLACDPDILIADEATTAFDVTIQAQILTQLAGTAAPAELRQVRAMKQASLILASMSATRPMETKESIRRNDG